MMRIDNNKTSKEKIDVLESTLDVVHEVLIINKYYIYELLKENTIDTVIPKDIIDSIVNNTNIGINTINEYKEHYNK